MPKLLVNGVNLSYQQFGCGSDLVMIHGLAANRAFWYLPIAQHLEQKFRITLYDLRGHGYSDTPPSGYTAADMTRDLKGLLDRLEIRQATLVGHSFGGLIALHYALKYPQQISSLVLADSRIYALQPLQRLQDVSYRSPLEEQLLSQSDRDWEREPHIGLRFLEAIAKEQWGTRTETDEGEFIPFKGIYGGSRMAKKWVNLLNQTTARQDFERDRELTVEQIRQLSQPLLAIYGERSRCLDSCNALKKLLPACQTQIVPGVGHFHPVTQPQNFLNALTDFLKTTNCYAS
ncbi:MAG: alpha/beta hydrolase [Cyanobacteriota bacterium]|nr:alpha/beta hydrolase [Cyanobacteriota bacterium]